MEQDISPGEYPEHVSKATAVFGFATYRIYQHLGKETEFRQFYPTANQANALTIDTSTPFKQTSSTASR
jgi:hypothetical protein